MHQLKKYSIILVCFLLVFSSAPFATTISAEAVEGEVAGKEEVVYATLKPTGENKEVYVVNSLEIVEDGRITDYGKYDNLKNLTDLSELEQSGDEVELSASEGKFYYQGDLKDPTLPWEFNISYFLDDEEMDSETLAGQDGNVGITIETKENEEVDSIFFDNYLLQISLVFDGDTTRNIETEDGMLANAGKDIQVTFTIMPEEEETVSVTADVIDFELSGIDINAVPQNMSIDPPDTDEFTDDIVTLSDALQEIDEGVIELKNGTHELDEGAKALYDGSTSYQEGMNALSDGSGELVSGSQTINEALTVMDRELSTELDDLDIGEMSELTEGLTELSEALSEVEDGLGLLKDNYGKALSALDGALEDIPGIEISEEEIGELYSALHQTNRDSETLDQLLAVYESAMVAKGTYQEVKEGFAAVEDTLEETVPALSMMATSIDEVLKGFQGIDPSEITSGITELQEGIALLSSNYQEFHDGIITYTNGVDELATGYAELDRGIGELQQGTGELTDGVSELQEGTSELADATKEMPEQVTEEIDAILSQYDGSDFEPASFVSEKNENVNSVQFVLTTEPIEIEEEEVEEEVEEEKSLWQKFLDLFR
jgi:X-X-X-Leu-X-X-Gly heptad repeat protein